MIIRNGTFKPDQGRQRYRHFSSKHFQPIKRQSQQVKLTVHTSKGILSEIIY